MAKIELLAKQNADGSYSTAIPADILVRYSFVDFYEENRGEGPTGNGYQRNESGRDTRGRSVEKYLKRSIEKGQKAALFEMTGNIQGEIGENTRYSPLDDYGELGILEVITSDNDQGEKPFISIIDGGTRLLGIEKALRSGVLDASTRIDIRLFKGKSFVEEVAYFLLINQNQKKVRTDLAIRVVQQLRDNSEISPGSQEWKALESALQGGSDAWEYTAVRMTGELNSDASSPWSGRIQMPHGAPNCIALQAYFTSLKPMLNSQEIKTWVETMKGDSKLKVDGIAVKEPSEFFIKVLKNFWEAVKAVNPSAYKEPSTTVLWAPIGVNSHHFALTKILENSIRANKVDFAPAHFELMLKGSLTENYDFWWTKKGTEETKKGTEEPSKEKGEATTLTGMANYGHLAGRLYNKWTSTLIQDSSDIEEVDL